MLLFLFMFMKGGGGGGTTTVTQTTVVPAPTPEETEQIALNNKLLKASIALNYDEVDGKLVFKPDILAVRDFEMKNALADQENIVLGRAALTKFLKGDISITDEQRKIIDDTVDKAFTQPALSELSRFKEERSQQFKEQAATLGRGGLDPTFERELTKEIGKLEKDVQVGAGVQKAQQAFQLGTSQPLQAGQIAEGLSQFRQALIGQQQQNAQNLMNLLQQRADSLAQQRFASASSKSTSTTSGGGGGGGIGLGGIGSFLGGIGSFLGGIGSI